MPTRAPTVALALLALGWPAAAAEPAKPAVPLVVLVVFDQMRGDYVVRWRDQFGPDGFRRLQAEGAWYPDCHYPYASTATGPGHAALLSGATPSRTGIINNEWYDRSAAAEVYCAGMPKYAQVPAAKSAAPTTAAATDPEKKPEKPKPYGSPERMLAETGADSLKAATGGKGKVFGVSLKDRSALLPSGKRPDGAFWFTGQFVTSTYYADAVPEWVAAFNKSGRAEAYFGKAWAKGNTGLPYDALSGPDDQAGEGKGVGQGVQFPHPLTGGVDKRGAAFADVAASGGNYNEAQANEPIGNELLLDFAKACIDAEKLGRHDAPDLLTVSFSSNDLVGHTWGPDSQEVMDCTLRADAVLADLLKHLDKAVGAGKYAVVVSSDHGICPLPEVAAKCGLASGRIPALPLVLGAERFLRAKFNDAEPGGKEVVTPEANKADEKKPVTRWIEAISAPSVYLNHKLLKAKGLKPDDVAADLAGWLVSQDGVLSAYTEAALRDKKVPEGDAVGQRVLKSYYPGRTGDVYVVMKPFYLLKTSTTGRDDTGTTHGSPHDYDRHVPLFVAGPGVAPGTRKEAVTPLHAAAVAARFLGVPPPKDAEYGVPKGLWKE